MIVRMNKVTLLCVAARRDETLAALRDLGAVHLEHVRAPAGEDLERARERFARVQRALEVLPKRAAAKPSGRPADAVVKDIWDLIHRKKELEQALDALKYERQRLEPYGSFDPAAIRQLAERGIQVRLYHAARGAEPEVPADAAKVILREDREGVYFAVVGRGDVPVQAAELRLPEQPLDDVVRRIAETERSLADVESGLQGHAGDYPVVAQAVREAAESLRYVEARSGMGAAEPVAYLRGFIPAESAGDLRGAAARNGWGLLVEEPGPDDRVPTLIRNPRWIRPIQTIFDALGILPGYKEIDISASFLAFLSVFFAMIVGDAGYGVLFLVLTRWARKKMPAAPARIFQFLQLMSVCTIVWGVVTGTYFSIPVLPGVLQRLKIPWLGNERNVMLLSFILGSVHLTVAHLWNVILGIRSLKALAQLGWIGMTWTMFFIACTMVLGIDFSAHLPCGPVPVLNVMFPKFMMPVFFASLAGIVLFMTPLRDLKTEWYNHALLPLTLVSNFIDVVSYIRLYAVGVAGVAIASSFNQMATAGVSGIVSGLAAALILFLGHALNLTLSALGVLVHGVRLNVLEFTNHIGMQWTGFAYQPFSRPRGGAAEQA